MAGAHTGRAVFGFQDQLAVFLRARGTARTPTPAHDEDLPGAGEALCFCLFAQGEGAGFVGCTLSLLTIVY